MLKGHVFDLQTFTSSAFAIFIDEFLNGRAGVAKGCELSKTNNSVTINSGFFVIKGRFLEIIGNETISNLNNNGYYKLVCEIDMNKTNTEDYLNQAVIKTLYNASSYPNIITEDLTDGGKIYQYEFARFKVEGGAITDFTDSITYVNFESIFDSVENETNELIQEVEMALTSVLNESIFVLKNDYAVLTGTIAKPVPDSNMAEVDINYPTGFTWNNCYVQSIMFKSQAGNAWSNGTTFDSVSLLASGMPYVIMLMEPYMKLHMRNLYLYAGGIYENNLTRDFEFKIILKKY